MQEEETTPEETPESPETPEIPEEEKGEEESAV